MSSCNIKIFYFQEFFRAHHEFSDNFFYVRLFHRMWVARDNEKYCSIFLPAAKSRDLVKIRCATSKAPNKTETFITPPSSTLKRSMPYIQRFFEAVRDFNFVINDTAQRNMLRFFSYISFSFYFFRWATQQRYLNQHSFKLHKRVRDAECEMMMMIGCSPLSTSLRNVYILNTCCVHWGGVASAALSLLYLSSRHHMW